MVPEGCRRCAIVLGLALAVSSRAGAEQGPQHLTLHDAVAAALANHPRLRETKAAENAASAAVEQAGTLVLPAVGVSGELNRSTGNNVEGAFFQAPGFPAVTGVPATKSYAGVWQTGLSVWGYWDATSVARRDVTVEVARASRSQAGETSDAQRLEIAYGAADAFLGLLTSHETVVAARAAVDRAQVFARVVRTLVEETLRPGADAARADAEVALAQTELAHAEQAEAVQRTVLTEAMGTSDEALEPITGRLLEHADVPPAPEARVQDHPFVRERVAAVTLKNAERRAIDAEYLPNITLAATAWTRGSGLSGSPAGGLLPDTPDWAAGVVVSWNGLAIPSLRAKTRVAEALESAAASREAESALAVSGLVANANALVEGAVRIARDTPVALTAAEAAFTQASARYKAGLATVVDVADAQRLLAQTQVEDAVARLGVWRAWLLRSRASGSLSSFMEAADPGQGGP